MSPHAQSCGLPDACAERLWYNDLDALAPPCMVTVSFSYFTSSRRVFATFPHTLKSSHPQLDACLSILALCGLLLFLGGIGLGAYLIGSSLIVSSFTSPPQICITCSISPGYYSLNLKVYDSTISDNQTDALIVYFDYFPQNNDPQNIPLTVTLLAPDFNPTPAISEHTLPLQGSVTLGWVLSPAKPGTFR